MNDNEAIEKIRENLTPDLLKPKYRKRVMAGAHFTTGHCYVASEAFYYMTGAEHGEWEPHHIMHEDESHWYLKNKITGKVVDITAEQFTTPIFYEHGKRMAFLTDAPSIRCQLLLDRIHKAMQTGVRTMNCTPNEPEININGKALSQSEVMTVRAALTIFDLYLKDRRETDRTGADLNHSFRKNIVVINDLMVKS